MIIARKARRLLNRLPAYAGGRLRSFNLKKGKKKKKAIKTVGTAARHNYNDGEYCEGKVVKVHGVYEVRLIGGEIIETKGELDACSAVINRHMDAYVGEAAA